MEEREVNSIWVENYRPRKFDDYVGNQQMIDKFRSFVEHQDIGHVILYGDPGTGKCLNFNELIDIEIELSDDELKIFEEYIIK